MAPAARRDRAVRKLALGQLRGLARRLDVFADPLAQTSHFF
jgi:hypothetical protein